MRHMFAAQPICILWDASHIWGLMAWRAVRALGLPCRLVKGKEIAEGAYLGKPMVPSSRKAAHSGGPGVSLLLVPGGNARLKAMALGKAGCEAVRQWVHEGGNYLGFCGGAGLALTHPNPDHGLNLCPWARAAYPERLYHLISGHIRAHISPGHEFSPQRRELPEGSPTASHLTPGMAAQCPSARRAAARQQTEDAPQCAFLPSLPVWWPGRFAPEKNDKVTVLASYGMPDKDFWLADLTLQSIPPKVFSHWRDLYGLNLSADFLAGQPMAVTGNYGQGRYVLSYSHLETPHSPDANAWLAQLLRSMTGLEPTREDVPLWQLRHPCAAWPEGTGGPLLDALRHMRELLDLAVAHHLFFGRTHWLWGWRTGLPGAACNNLHAALCTAASLEPSPAALAYWQQVAPRFAELESLFATGAEEFFLACRLAETLSPTMPDAVDKRGLDHQRESLFGHPMSGGGILSELLEVLEELVYLSQTSMPCDLA